MNQNALLTSRYLPRRPRPLSHPLLPLRPCRPHPPPAQRPALARPPPPFRRGIPWYQSPPQKRLLFPPLSGRSTRSSLAARPAWARRHHHYQALPPLPPRVRLRYSIPSCFRGERGRWPWGRGYRVGRKGGWGRVKRTGNGYRSWLPLSE